MFKKMKNIKPSMLITHLIITLAYPAVKALASPVKRLLIFTDAMTIVALILVILGIIYSLILHGDFDISSYYLQHGARSARYAFTRRGAEEQQKKSIDEFILEAREKRENSFNYPLFLGIVYLIASLVIAYGFLS